MYRRLGARCTIPVLNRKIPTMIGYRTHRRVELIGQSAVTYLVLGIPFGIHLAFSLVALTAVVVGWWKLCVRFPLVGIATLGFFEGLLGRRGGHYRRRWCVKTCARFHTSPFHSLLRGLRIGKRQEAAEGGCFIEPI